MGINFQITILYQDDQLIVVEKPEGLAVHKNDFMPHDAPYLTKLLGESTGKWIYNVHRLDAKTSGLMVLAFSPEIAKDLTLQFEQKEVLKKYTAVVQGYPAEGTFSDKVLVKKKTRIKKPAVTHYKTLQHVKTTISYKEKSEIILSIVEIMPETGRWHQIRQHFAKNRFDIVGDAHHGDFTLNKIITEKTGINRLLLHASELQFNHPLTKKRETFYSSVPEEFMQLLNAGL